MASVEGNSEPNLSKNAEKRLSRQHQKAVCRLKQREGIEASKASTKNLYAANAGLQNGITRGEVEKIFGVYGQIDDIIMDETKPHAFVCYSNLEDAEKANGALNGKVLSCPEEVSVAGVKIFTAFVNTVPGQPELAGFDELPPGLTIVPDIVDEEYEQKLIEVVEWDPEVNDEEVQSSLKHRRVKHYGYEFIYGLNNVNPDQPLPNGIPEVCEEFLCRLEKMDVLSARPDQLTVNHYLPGQGIPPHVDTHSAFTDTIISLSLGSDCVMEFGHPDGRQCHVILPRRSALIMAGESRYVWTHCIKHRKSDLVRCEGGGSTLQYRGTRTSFTFRRLRRKPCDCNYPAQCDSRKEKMNSGADRLVLPQSELEALRLESDHVHKVYEDIAGHFSDTRHSPWPRVSQFLHSLPDHSLVVDVGCGNGKYLGVNGRLRMIGTDRSSNLVKVCVDRGREAFVCDVTALPWREGVCDACICIAVIHHLSTEERRLSAIRQLIRLLRPGGLCLIYVWALEQELHKVKSKYLKESKMKVKQRDGDQQNESKLPVHVNGTKFDKQDLLVPWHLKNKGKDSGNVYHRFYHVFEEGELEKLCSRVEGVTTVESYHDNGNWCVVLRKEDNKKS